jgi:hypothetical protein
MSNVTATVLLSQDYRATCMGWDRAVEYVEVATFDIATKGDPLADCEVVYAICNSHPGEMFCSPEYAEEVETYREGRNRSLSVGDLVQIGEGIFAVADCGFEVAARPKVVSA